MAYEETLKKITLLAAQDFSVTGQFRFGIINAVGKIALATSGSRINGVILNNPGADEAVTFGIDGIAMVEYGGTVLAGQEVQSDSVGRAILHDESIIGMALENGNAGEIHPVLLKYLGLLYTNQLLDVNASLPISHGSHLNWYQNEWIPFNDNVVLVRGDDDLIVSGSTLSGGIIYLEYKEYLFVNSYSSPYGLGWPIVDSDPDGALELKGVNRAIRTHTGNIAAFYSLAANGTMETFMMEFHSPNAPMFHVVCDEYCAWQGLFTRIRNCPTLGYVENTDWNIFFGSITGFDDGFRFVNCGYTELDFMFFQGNTDTAKLDFDGQTSAATKFQVGENITDGTATATVRWVYQNGLAGTLVIGDIVGEFTNNQPLTGDLDGEAVVDGALYRVRYLACESSNEAAPINMFFISTDPGPYQSLFYFDPSIVIPILITLTQRFEELEGVMFDDNSLKPALLNSKTQKSFNVTAAVNQLIPDSQITATVAIVNNATTTAFTEDVPAAINAIRQPIVNAERMVYQDVCTFNGTTNVISTTFTQGMINGAVIQFKTAGALPTGLSEDTDYYVRNVTATTFQVSLTLTGAIIDFTGNGTGTNYFRHETGNSSTGWLIYVGALTETIFISGWASLNKSGTAVIAGIAAMKTSATAPFASTLQFRGSDCTVSNNIAQSSSIAGSIQLSNGEGIRIFGETRDASATLTIQNSSYAIFKS